MGTLTTIAGFLAVITVIVFIHEMGHFLVARWCGVTVHTFSIGFGKELYHWFDKQGTRWRIALVPLGGYVKFIDDANGASAGAAPEDELEKMSPEERAGAFRLKPLWQRAAVVAAGPLANFLLAIALYACVAAAYGVRMPAPVFDVIKTGGAADIAGLKSGDRVLSAAGEDIESFDELDMIIATNAGREVDLVIDRGGGKLLVPITPVSTKVKNFLDIELEIGDIGASRLQEARIGALQPDMPAVAAGLKPGDLLLSIDDKPVTSFETLAMTVGASAGRTLALKVDRAGEQFSVTLTPVTKSVPGPDGKMVDIGRVGITPALPPLVSVSPFDALNMGVKETWSVITNTLAGIRDMVVGRQSADQLGGAIMMGEVTGQAMESGLDSTLRLLAYFSVSIGLLNLFPIPVLDGGHLMFYAYEAVFRRPLPLRVQEIAFRVGFAILITLMIFANGNDILRKAKSLLGSIG
jgi:regulator of sigma E protease